ncbi:hypothetical protein LTR95_017109 [Oleoguttula sp. CCFEE 5521]
MAEKMTESRHDFAAHSNTKVDEFNERLSKLVSRIPETKRTGDDVDDIESITSDPTELFHRDMGTQTSPPLSPSSSVSTEAGAHSIANKHADRLASLNSELASILSGSESADAATKVRQEKLDELHNYLDNTLYRSQPVSVWSSGVDANEEKGRWDAVEELKKEIRGVKGVLLSAKSIQYKDTLTVKVGMAPNDHIYTVHKDFIALRSTFFKSATSRGWKKGDTPVDLSEHDTISFEAYLHCVYAKEILFEEPESSADLSILADFENLLNLYILADKLGDLMTANYVIDELIRRSDSRDALPCHSDTSHTIGEVAASSPLRRLLVDWSVHDADGELSYKSMSHTALEAMFT